MATKRARTMRDVAKAAVVKAPKKGGGRARGAAVQERARGEGDLVTLALDQVLDELEFAEMNKTEARFARELALREKLGEVRWWAFEPMSLRLGKSSWYKGDFLALGADGRLTMYEVKGHWEIAARVRVKVAARLFPWIRFVAVKAGAANATPTTPAWQYEEIAPWVSTSTTKS